MILRLMQPDSLFMKLTRFLEAQLVSSFAAFKQSPAWQGFSVDASAHANEAKLGRATRMLAPCRCPIPCHRMAAAEAVPLPTPSLQAGRHTAPTTRS